jgi:diguanylate cyclase (GGDEF)-like protein
MLWFSPRSLSPAVAPDDASLLDAVESFLAKGRHPTVLPTWLERRYERDMGPLAGRWLARDAYKAAIVYNLLVFVDMALTPDVTYIACLIHLGIVTPLMMFFAKELRRAPSLRRRQFVGAAIPLMMVMHIVTLYLLSEAPSASAYLYFVTMVAMFANVTLRLDARAAGWASLAALLLLAFAQAISGRVPLGMSSLQCFALALGSLVALDGNLSRDRALRHSYVQTLRDSLRIAATASEARRDPLTGLANRRRLEEAATKIWRDPLHSGAISVAAVLFDVDHFKTYNDVYGHQAGDLCLKRIAEGAASVVGERDGVLARYGGEEFMLLAPRLTLEQALAVAERVRAKILDLDIPRDGADDNGRVTASFGVACVDVPQESFSALTAAADMALYAAKRAGRNRVVAAPNNSERRLSIPQPQPPTERRSS